MSTVESEKDPQVEGGGTPEGEGAVSAPPSLRGLARMGWGRARGLLRRDDDAGVVARGASTHMMVAAAATLLGFGTQLVLTRTLGDEGYGVYAYVMGWINTVVMFTTADFGTAALRFVGSYAGEGKWGKVRVFLRQTSAIVFALTFLVALAFAAFVYLQRDNLSPVEYSSYMVGCLLLPATAIIVFFADVFQALKKVLLSQAPTKILRPILLVAIFLSWGGLASGTLTPTVALTANLIASVIALLVAGVGYLRTVHREKDEGGDATSELPFWMKTVVGLLAVSLSQSILGGQLDVVVVGSLIGTVEAGQYSVAMLVVKPATLAFGGILFMSTPLVAQYYASRPREDLQRLVSIVSRVNVAVTLPGLILLGLFGRPFISFVFGPDFVGAYPILLVLLITSLLSAAVGGLSGFVLSMTGHQNSAAVLIGISAAVYMGLTYPLTAAYGAVGTAIATFLAYLVRSILLTWFIRRRLKINILPIPWPVRG